MFFFLAHAAIDSEVLQKPQHFEQVVVSQSLSLEKKHKKKHKDSSFDSFDSSFYNSEYFELLSKITKDLNANNFEKALERLNKVLINASFHCFKKWRREIRFRRVVFFLRGDVIALARDFKRFNDCHFSVEKALGDFVLGEEEKGFKCIRSLLKHGSRDALLCILFLRSCHHHIPEFKVKWGRHHESSFESFSDIDCVDRGWRFVRLIEKIDDFLGVCSIEESYSALVVRALCNVMLDNFDEAMEDLRMIPKGIVSVEIAMLLFLKGERDKASFELSTIPVSTVPIKKTSDLLIFFNDQKFKAWMIQRIFNL
jgi:hypothetical protein